MASGARMAPVRQRKRFFCSRQRLGNGTGGRAPVAREEWAGAGAFVIVEPNVRAKLAPTVGRAGPVGENVQRTADRARVARRWGSA